MIIRIGIHIHTVTSLRTAFGQRVGDLAVHTTTP